MSNGDNYYSIDRKGEVGELKSQSGLQRLTCTFASEDGIDEEY